MDVLTDTKMPDRCADGLRTPKHMVCTDAPQSPYHMGEPRDVQGYMGGIQMSGSIWTYRGYLNVLWASKCMGVYGCPLSLTTPCLSVM